MPATGSRHPQPALVEAHDDEYDSEQPMSIDLGGGMTLQLSSKPKDKKKQSGPFINASATPLFNDERVRDSASDIARENGSDAAASDRGIRDEGSDAQGRYANARSGHRPLSRNRRAMPPPPDIYPPFGQRTSYSYLLGMPPPPAIPTYPEYSWEAMSSGERQPVPTYMSPPEPLREVTSWDERAPLPAYAPPLDYPRTATPRHERPAPRSLFQPSLENGITSRSQEPSGKRGQERLTIWLDSFAARKSVAAGPNLRSAVLEHLLEENYDDLFEVFPKKLPRAIEDHVESRVKTILGWLHAGQERYGEERAWHGALLPALIKQIRQQAKKLSELEAKESKGSAKHETGDAGTQTEMRGVHRGV